MIPRACLHVSSKPVVSPEYDPDVTYNIFWSISLESSADVGRKIYSWILDFIKHYILSERGGGADSRF